MSDNDDLGPEPEIDRYAPADWWDTQRDIVCDELAATVAGWGAPLLYLHGFTGSGDDWMRDRWANRFTTIAVDLPGHGKSAALTPQPDFSMPETVAGLLKLLDQLKIERTAVIGYSLGGRVALQLAVAAPERVAALVLVSTTPGIADPTERAERVAADEALAQRIEREGVPAFIDYWEQLPLFQASSREKEFNPRFHEVRRQRQLQNSAAGLAASLRGMGTGAQESLWDRLDTLKMPALVMAGEHDSKFVAIARRMAQRLPNAKLALIADAGHRIELDAPHRFFLTALPFLLNLTVWTSKGD